MIYRLGLVANVFSSNLIIPASEGLNIYINKFIPNIKPVYEPIVVCNKRSFSTESITKLHPWFITGFTDGEGCFSVSVYKNNELETNWRVQVNFSIGLHERDVILLEYIKNAFNGIGKISSPRKGIVKYGVTSIKQLQIIINHFDKYPLITQKFSDFELFKQVLDIINRKEHLTVEGLEKIVAIRATINRGLTDKLKAAFPNIVPVNRPLITSQKISHPEWLSGFTSAEGCFWIYIFKSTTTKMGQSVNLIFKLAQHVRDEQLFMSLVEYLGCGKIYFEREAVYYRVTKYSDISEKIIPFFKKYPIVGVKALDFKDFKKVSELMKNRDHLTSEGLDSIRQIKNGMNRGRE